jgi:predicted DNA binding CopG/RHH family protein
MNQKAKPIDSPSDIPAGLSDEDRTAFLEEHGVSEYFLENVEEAPEEERPGPRTKPINVRFDDFTLGRLKDLAESRNIGYQTLLKEFVVERLYEEEKRRSVLSAGQMSEAESAGGSSEDAEPQKTVKPRDWQSWVYDFVKENEELLEDPGIDSITLSRLAKNSSAPLLELSREIRKASAKEGYPAPRLRRMLKGYDRLKEFTETALALYAEKFEALEEDGDAVIREAERIVEQSR